MSVALRAHVQRHLDAVAGVVGNAADLDGFPPGAQVAAAHLGVGLETAGRQHDGAPGDVLEPVGSLDPQAGDSAHLVLDQRDALGGVAHLDTQPLAHVKLLVGQALAGADGLHDQAAPEAELVAVAEGLASEGQHEPDAVLLQPLHCRVGVAYQDLGQLGVGQAVGDAHHVVVKLVLGVLAHLDGVGLGLRHVGNQALDVVQAVVGEADDAAGEVGVAAAEILWSFLHHEHRLGLLAGGDGGGQSGVSGPDDDYIIDSVISRHSGTSNRLAGARPNGEFAAMMITQRGAAPWNRGCRSHPD